jgi:hypothetical protein
MLLFWSAKTILSELKKATFSKRRVFEMRQKKVLFHQKKISNNIILLIFYVYCVNFQFYTIILDMLASILNKEKKIGL